MCAMIGCPRVAQVNRFSQKIIRNKSENFHEIWQPKFSETAFLAKSAGNGVRNLVRDANSDPMLKKSSKLDKWKHKIRISVKINEIHDFQTIF